MLKANVERPFSRCDRALDSVEEPFPDKCPELVEINRPIVVLIVRRNHCHRFVVIDRLVKSLKR